MDSLSTHFGGDRTLIKIVNEDLIFHFKETGELWEHLQQNAWVRKSKREKKKDGGRPYRWEIEVKAASVETTTGADGVSSLPRNCYKSYKERRSHVWKVMLNLKCRSVEIYCSSLCVIYSWKMLLQPRAWNSEMHNHKWSAEWSTQDLTLCWVARGIVCVRKVQTEWRISMYLNSPKNSHPSTQNPHANVHPHPSSCVPWYNSATLTVCSSPALWVVRHSQVCSAIRTHFISSYAFKTMINYACCNYWQSRDSALHLTYCIAVLTLEGDG